MWWLRTILLALKRLRQEDCHEYEASLVCNSDSKMISEEPATCSSVCSHTKPVVNSLLKASVHTDHGSNFYIILFIFWGGGFFVLFCFFFIFFLREKEWSIFLPGFLLPSQDPYPLPPALIWSTVPGVCNCQEMKGWWGVITVNSFD